MDQQLRWIMVIVGALILAFVLFLEFRARRKSHSEDVVSADEAGTPFEAIFDDDDTTDLGLESPRELFKPTILGVDAPATATDDTLEDEYDDADNAEQALSTEPKEDSPSPDLEAPEDEVDIPSFRVEPKLTPVLDDEPTTEAESVLPENVADSDVQMGLEIDPPAAVEPETESDDLSKSADHDAAKIDTQEVSLKPQGDESVSGGLTQRLLAGLGRLSNQSRDVEIAKVQAPELALIMYVVAKPDQFIHGPDLSHALVDIQCTFDGQYFNSMQGEQTVFTITNLKQPGVFESNDLNGTSFNGIAAILTLPSALGDSEAFEIYIERVKQLGERLGARVLDENRSSLTQQTISHFRDKIRRRAIATRSY
ncbi:MAG: hypothetical protein HWE20_13905 [Gammaproteobacteria bacterium]|nr:hypothetical protein [Gammaproteobacteria bacterium]